MDAEKNSDEGDERNRQGMKEKMGKNNKEGLGQRKWHVL